MKHYLIGCSGWHYQDWVGPFYPEDLSQREWLPFYARHFPTVEVNSTFYHFPREATLRSWYRRTPEDFVFTLKVYQSITHRRKFKGTEEMVRRFYQVSQALEEKLGGFLFQIPPNVGFGRELLERILGQLDPSQRNTLEFRHRSWFTEEAYGLLQEQGVAACVVSAPGLPEAPVVTAPHAFVRFHGKDVWYAYRYSEGQLRRWAEIIRELSADPVFAYFNNDPQAWAPQNAGELTRLLSSSEGPR